MRLDICPDNHSLTYTNTQKHPTLPAGYNIEVPVKLHSMAFASSKRALILKTSERLNIALNSRFVTLAKATKRFASSLFQPLH